MIFKSDLDQRIRSILVALCITACAPAVAGEAFPSKPVRWVVPYAAGGPTETIARLLGRKVSEPWAQQVVIDLRPGANSIIGTEIAHQAQPDGYTMLIALPAFVINPHVYRKLPYSIHDFIPVTNIASASYLMLVNSDVNAKTPRELIALAKDRPGKLNFASGGTASPAHLAMELFMDSAGITMTHVPYKGGAPALTDLIAGRVHVLVNPALSAAAHVRGGKIRAIAVTGNERSQIFPALPTIAESGLKGYDVGTWYGLFAPAGTPPLVINRAADAVRTALKDTVVQESLVKLDAKPLGPTPSEFSAFVESEMRKWKGVVERANISLDR